MSEGNGGPAFPMHLNTGTNQEPVWVVHPGMTLRDYFAAHMPDLYSEWNFHQRAAALGMGHDEWLKDPIGSAAAFEAMVRYRYADAMLAERARRAEEKP